MGTRDSVGRPIGFLVFTLKARVTTVLTNRSRRFAHVDVMQHDKEEGGFGSV